MNDGRGRHLPFHLDEGSTRCHSHLDPATDPGSTPGHSLRVGEEREMAAHAESCHAVGVLFVPLVVEYMGGWSDEAIHTIASIGRLQGQRLGIPRQRVYDTSSRDWPSRYGKGTPHWIRHHMDGQIYSPCYVFIY